METPQQIHPLQESAQRDSTISTRYFVCSAIGGILCISGTISQEELLAYTGFGGFFILGGIGFAYRVGADYKLREYGKINAR